VRIAKADLVPTGANLLGASSSLGALERACEGSASRSTPGRIG
jgi:hypothetical protein